jgi:hypothetical protein
MTATSPNAHYLGDTVKVERGWRPGNVTITAFKDHLVEVEYPVGSRGLRPHSALKRKDTHPWTD